MGQTDGQKEGQQLCLLLPLWLRPRDNKTRKKSSLITALVVYLALCFVFVALTMFWGQRRCASCKNQFQKLSQRNRLTPVQVASGPLTVMHVSYSFDSKWPAKQWFYRPIGQSGAIYVPVH